MKRLRPFLLSLALAAAGAPLAAQQPKPTVKPTPPVAAKPVEPAKPAELALPAVPTRVAYVTSEAFMDEKYGLKKLVKIYQGLAAQFKSRQAEIINLSKRINSLAQEVDKLRTNPASDKNVIAAKELEGMQLQNTLQFKQQDAQKDYDRRSHELRAPVEAELVRELQVFVQERRIGMLFDVSKMGGGLVAAKPELDVTNDFIAYFNTKHP